MKKIFLGLLCTALLVSGTGIASAQSISLSQLVELFISLGIIAPDKAGQARTAVQNAQNGKSPAACFTFEKNLRIGDRGTDVDELVKRLIQEGLIPNRLNQTVFGEDYNEQVASAVSEFQEKYASEVLQPHGLRRGTGFVGASTRVKLNALCGRTSVERPVVTDVV